MHAKVTVPLGLVLCAVACSSSTDFASPRESARLVAEATSVDCVGEMPDCEVGKWAITDVRRDGERVGVLVLQEGSRLVHLYLSEDRGDSWKQAAVGGDLVEQYIWRGGSLQLLLHEGKAWLFLQTAEAAGGSTAERMRFAEFDLSSGKLKELSLDTFLHVGPAAVDSEGRLTVVGDTSDVRGGPLTRGIQAFDLSSRSLDVSHELCADKACGDTFWQPTTGGTEWQALGVVPSGNGFSGEACRYLYRYTGRLGQSSPYTERHCVPYALWPSGLRSGTGRQQEVFPHEGGALHVVYERGGITYARTVENGAMTTPLLLGPGKPMNPYGFSSRSRLGGLAAISRPSRTGAASTLVRLLSPTSAEEIDLPPFPCENNACGDEKTRSDYGALAWLEPLGGDEYLAFWIIDTEGPGRRHEALFAERLTVKRSPIRTEVEGFEPEEDETSPIPAYPGARPAKELIGACARLELCGLGAFDQCVSRYGTNGYHLPASREEARARLIDASLQGCEALRAELPPAGCADSCLASGGLCTAGGGCDLGEAEPDSSCSGRRVGTYCSNGRVIACNSVGGATVKSHCTRSGLVCVDKETSGEPRAVCEPEQLVSASCDGDIARNRASYAHCEDFAQTCIGAGKCEYRSNIPSDSKCHWGTARPLCAGEYALHCIGDWLHYTSCTELGFAGCAETGAGATCVR